MNLVVIGAVAAGMSAASKAKRLDAAVNVRVFGQEEHVSYAACGLPYYIGDMVVEQKRLFARSVAEFAGQGIEVNTGHTVRSILPDDRQIVVVGPGGEEQRVDYDKLVIATGARPVLPPIPGLDLDNVFTVSTIGDAERIRAAITGGAKRAVIVGGGYIGLEMAEALHQRGLETVVVERSPQIAGTMDEDMAEHVAAHMQKTGIEVRTAVAVESLIGNGEIQAVRTDHGDIRCDLAIVAVGVQPNSELARDAGIRLGVRNAIAVNRYMETSAEDIYAAGDCAVSYHVLYGGDAYIPLGTTANKQGRIAGENALGGKVEFSGVVGTGIMKVLDLGVARTGLSTREAKSLGRELLSVRITVNNRASYYPQPGRGSLVKLLFSADGRIWGAQMVGPDGFAKRIDLFAAAIQLGLTVHEVAGLDLSYSPPFSPVWDPVLTAANVAVSKLQGAETE